MNAPLFESQITSLPLIGRGKVRDIYAVGEDRLLIVTTDRLSAFDVVLPDPIPDKGRVLTTVSNFWFERLGHIVQNHLTGIDPEMVVGTEEERDQVRGRAIVAARLAPLPIEAVVRGYLIGSGWKDYQQTRRSLRHQAAAGPAVRQAGCPSPSSPPPPRRKPGPTTRTSVSTKSRARRGTARPAGEGGRATPLRRSGGVRPHAAASSSQTRNSSSGSTPRASCT